MPRRLRRSSLKLAVAFLATLAALVAQDPTSYLTPDVMRVGELMADYIARFQRDFAAQPV